MWINITKEIFEKSEFKSLNFLYQILSWYPSDSSLRYNIVVDTRNVIKTKNFIQLSSVEKNLKEFLDLEYVNFANTNSNVAYKIAYKKKENNFNIEEAILFFNQPVSIILENNKNDSIFVSTIIENFGNDNSVNKAKKHLENNWLKFENAGGCSNIPNFLEMFLSQFQKLALKNQRHLSNYFRGLIIIDSDKEYKTQASKHNNLIINLNSLGISNDQIHILQKRMIENYMPDDIFREIKNQLYNQTEITEWIDVYLNLEKEQKNYLNIPDGFPPKKNKFESDGKRKNIDFQILSLFNLNITDINFIRLDKGFGFNGFENNSEFKNEFPKLFKKQIVNKNNLSERDGENELFDIVNKINKLL